MLRIDRLLLRLAGIALLLAVAAAAPAAAAPAARPNVLVVSVCSIRADHASLHGYPRATTPVLEELAGEAVVFHHAVTPWPKTVPAFGSLLTGRYPHTTGVVRVTPGQTLADGETTLAEVLAAHGYDTAAFVTSPALHAGTALFEQGFSRVDYTFLEEPGGDRAATTAALDWLRQRARPSTGQGAGARRPFLAWVHFNGAHQPYSPPSDLADLFVDDRFYDASVKVPLLDETPLDLPVAKDHPLRRQILRPDMGGVRKDARLPERPDQLAFYVARYDAAIRGVDRELGVLLAGLEELGRGRDTVVVVVGDHGEALGEHGYFFGHGRLPYDTTARVPFLVRPAGATGRRDVRAPVSTAALPATVLDLVGLPVPQTVEVPSLGPVLRGRRPPRHVFGEAGYQDDFMLTVREGRWKMIFVPNELDRRLMRGKELELYDLDSDPGETREISARHPELVRRLRRELLQWSRPWMRQAYTRSQPGKVEDPEIRRKLEALGYIP